MPGTLQDTVFYPQHHKKKKKKERRKGRVSSAECLGWELEPHFPSSATLDKSLLFPVPHLIQGNSNCTPAVGLLNGFHRCICTLVHTMPLALCNKCKVTEPKKGRVCSDTSRGNAGGSSWRCQEREQRARPGGGKVPRLHLDWVVLMNWDFRQGKVGGHFLQDRENRDALGGPVMGSSTARTAGACSGLKSC